MAQNDYATFGCSVNGGQVVELTSISKTTESGQLEIFTLARGLAGFSPGQGKCTIGLGYTIPVGGFEFNFDEAVANGTPVTVQLWVGPHSYNGNGKFTQGELSQSVGGASAGTVTFTGSLGALK